MKKLQNAMFAALVAVLALAGPALATDPGGVFPVDSASTTTITNLTADLTAWGVVIIGVALTIFAYRRVKSIVR